MTPQSSSFPANAVDRFGGKTVLVLGAARSGLAAAELLLALGSSVILSDTKTEDELPNIPETLRCPECVLKFGREADALMAEADFMIISPGISVEAPSVQKALQLGLPVIGELDFAASCAVQDIIAVSGTNGKTTTVSLLGEIFRQAGRVVHVAGNIGYPLSSAVLHAKQDDLLIVEVSSFQMETAEEFHPRAAVLLNITPDHLDRHHTMENYTALKLKMFEKQGIDDIAVFNHDDIRLREISSSIKSRLCYFSMCGSIRTGAVVHEGKLAWRTGDEYLYICNKTDLKIPGAHNVENALAAAAVAYQYGIPLPVIAYALKSFSGVEHRIEFVREVSGVRYLNDSKGTNPDSTVKAVESMEAPTVLIAGGYDKQVPFDFLAQCIVQSGVISHVVLIGQTAEKIAAALTKAIYQNFEKAGNLEEAVLLACGKAERGGNVLFSPACASFDMFHDYEERGRIFKHLVNELQDSGH